MKAENLSQAVKLMDELVALKNVLGDFDSADVSNVRLTISFSGHRPGRPRSRSIKVESTTGLGAIKAHLNKRRNDILAELKKLGVDTSAISE